MAVYPLLPNLAKPRESSAENVVYANFNHRTPNSEIKN